MLKLSTRTRYGLRALIELADGYGQGPTQVSRIVANQEISRKYLYSILNALREAKLVRSVRGVQGGFELSRPPEQITMLEIVVTLEGDVSLVPCMSETEKCPRSGECPAEGLWGDLHHLIHEFLESRLLSDLTCT